MLSESNGISQPVLLEMLEQAGMGITKQTLRNYERDGLITPPTRGAKYKGRWTCYASIVPAECYAAFMLLNTRSRGEEGNEMPKLSAKLIAKGRSIRAQGREQSITSAQGDVEKMLAVTMSLLAELLWFKFLSEGMEKFNIKEEESAA